jgi:5'-deoxynucleotidase YfbR-like HD superfamily hydrolase
MDTRAKLDEAKRGFMSMRSGALVALLMPDWRDISLDDVAIGLARIPRFLGQSRRKYSVLEHSLHVCGIVAERDASAAARTRLAALLHDAHEALTGDIPTPVVNALEMLQPGAKAAIDRLKAGIDSAISRAVVERFYPAGIPPSRRAEIARWLAEEMQSSAVKEADAIALEREYAALNGDELTWLGEPRLGGGAGAARYWLGAVEKAAREWLGGEA